MNEIGLDPVTTLETCVRIIVAAMCAAPIGWERGRKDHPAGLRSQILIAVGSAGFVLMSIRWNPANNPNGLYEIDPSRVLQGITSAIGVLAAGVIIRAGGSVRGFTTASSTWVVAAIGAACGFGQFVLAIVLATITILATAVLSYIDPKEHDPDTPRTPNAEP